MNRAAKSSPNVGIWIFLSVLLVVVAASGLVIYNNTQSNKRVQEAARQEKVAEEERESTEQTKKDTDAFNLSVCIGQAEKKYTDNWEATSKSYGRTDNKLPETEAKRYDDMLKDDKDNCYRIYGD